MQGATVFPIEVDLFEQTFKYNPSGQINDGISDDEESPQPSSRSVTGATSVKQSETSTSNSGIDENLLDLS